MESSKDFQAFENLQREVWGQNLSEVVTASLAQIVQKIGGVAAGAFEARGTMVGLVFGFTGFNHGRPVHWSHMLAVKSCLRDTGIGRKLKLYQREVLLRLGIKDVYWTYDPLVARNAHLNLNALGVEVSDYVPDMYGTGEDSDLFRGIGTDRFIVVWRINSHHVESILAGNRPTDLSPWSESPLAVSRNNPSNSASAPQTTDVLHASYIRVEVPPDIHVVRDALPVIAAEWRLATRRAFQQYFATGYRVRGFYRDEEAGRCFYCLRAKR